MKVTLENKNIHNDRPSYASLQELFGVQIDTVHAVDTGRSTCTITVESESGERCGQAISFLRSKGVEVVQVPNAVEATQRRLAEVIPTLHARIDETFSLSHEIKRSRSLDALFKMVVTPMYVLQSDSSMRDSLILPGLHEKGILLNYWDTGISKLDGRWSIVLANGSGPRDLSTLISRQGVKCVETWRRDEIREPLFADLVDHAERRIAQVAPYLRRDVVEDIVADMMKLLWESVGSLSTAVSGCNSAEIERIARLFGAFPNSIRFGVFRRLTRRKSEQRHLDRLFTEGLRDLNRPSKLAGSDLESADELVGELMRQKTSMQRGDIELIQLVASGYSLQKSAEVLGISLANAKVRKHRMLKSLRDAMLSHQDAAQQLSPDGRERLLDGIRVLFELENVQPE